jgi:hypothetical protein
MFIQKEMKIQIRELLLSGCGKNQGVFATNRKLTPNPILPNLSLQDKNNYTILLPNPPFFFCFSQTQLHCSPTSKLDSKASKIDSWLMSYLCYEVAFFSFFPFGFYEYFCLFIWFFCFSYMFIQKEMKMQINNFHVILTN